MKKILSFIMAAAMMLTLLIVPKYDSMAATGTYKLTISDSTHKYVAYQIFAGDLSASGELANIEWGDGVDGANLLADLVAATAFGTPSPFKDCTSAEDVAKVLGANAVFSGTDKDKNLAEFATMVSKRLKSTGKIPANDADASNVINGIAAGYYLVKDITDVNNGENAANSRFILDITKDTTITAKPVYPEIEKKILVDDGAGNKTKEDSNVATIGDKIEYQLDSAVPDMTGYNKYYYIVKDTLSSGLTFNNDVAIKIQTATSPETWKTLTSSEFEVSTSGTTNIEIVIKNFIQYQPYKDMPIVITYSATLNKDAVVGNPGNPNDVILVYSNDPTHEYVGDDKPSDNPDDGDVTGQTPKDTVITYTYQIKLTKVDGETNEVLMGAKFKITGESKTKVVVIRDEFTEAGDGTYYKLKDGTYTETAPTEATKDKYDSTTKLYKKSEVKEVKTLTAGVSEELAVGPDGIICFSHLGDGTYTIEETEAPTGYNKIDPFKVKIENGKYTILDKDGNAVIGLTNVTIDTDGIIKYTVENNKGVVLPSTGGMGTTIFYTVGGILVLLAAVLLITKKRMER